MENKSNTEQEQGSSPSDQKKTTKKTREITIQSLLASGAHYGHVTTVWHPKMAPYLYGTKSVIDLKRRFSNKKDVYIFNLDLTLKFWRRARKVIVENARKGGTILFVATKPQSREIVEREANRSNSFFVSHKWVGGMLTNFETLKVSVKKIEKLEKEIKEAKDPESALHYTKKEILLKQRELDKLLKKFGGVRTMKKAPDLVFVIDVARNHIAVEEASNLQIPVVGITDSNADPDKIDFIIPANDDAVGALDLIISNVADAVLEGKSLRQEQLLLENEGDDEFKEDVVVEGDLVIGNPDTAAPVTELKDENIEDNIIVTKKQPS